jgi:hypothetical protein
MFSGLNECQTFSTTFDLDEDIVILNSHIEFACISPSPRFLFVGESHNCKIDIEKTHSAVPALLEQ